MKEKNVMHDRRKSLREAPLILIVIAVVVLAIVSKNYFDFLETQLFAERQSHIVEFTEKAAEIIDNVMGFSWQQVYTCEHILRDEEIGSEEELFDMLVSAAELDFIDENNSLVVVFDSKGNYFSSDREGGPFAQTRLLDAGCGGASPQRRQFLFYVC